MWTVLPPFSVFCLVHRGGADSGFRSVRGLTAHTLARERSEERAHSEGREYREELKLEDTQNILALRRMGGSVLMEG